MFWKYLHELFDCLGFFIGSLYTTVATMIIYDFDGIIPITGLPAYTDAYGGSEVVAAGASLGMSGWIDCSDCGGAQAQVLITCHGTGSRNVEVAIDYARLIMGRLEVAGRQRHRNMVEVDYAPKVFLWPLELSLDIAKYIRIREINNDGAMTVTVDVKVTAPSRPLRSGISVVDREVDEELL